MSTTIVAHQSIDHEVSGDCCSCLHLERMADDSNWCKSDDCRHAMNLTGEGECLVCSDPTTKTARFPYVYHPRLKDQFKHNEKYCNSVAEINICASCLHYSRYDPNRPATGWDRCDLMDELQQAILITIHGREPSPKN